MLEATHPVKLASSKRTGVTLSVYLLLKDNNRYLLSLRNNTGYCDGFYGLISGHVEDGESALSAMIREAKEEAGIQISKEQLQLTYVTHRYTNRFNIDLFFECQAWSGTLINQEPEKCAALEFFALDKLPDNTIPYIKKALLAPREGKNYAEEGWETFFAIQCP